MVDVECKTYESERNKRIFSVYFVVDKMST